MANSAPPAHLINMPMSPPTVKPAIREPRRLTKINKYSGVISP